MADFLGLLAGKAKIDRERGVALLKESLANDSNVQSAQLSIVELMKRAAEESQIAWETKHGALLATAAVLQFTSPSVVEQFETAVKPITLRFLQDDEFRVRLAAGTQLLSV